MSSNIINSDTYRIHIDINDIGVDISGLYIVSYYILNNTSNENLYCALDVCLSTDILSKIINIKIEQIDNNIIKIAEDLSISSSNMYSQRTFALYTQVTKISFIFDSPFDGHIYGSIKKINGSYITNTSNISSVRIDMEECVYQIQ
jgi:hypothetical protein